MAGAAGNKNGNDRSGTEAGPRRPRRRTILNLGIPFVPVDDAVNQAEDAVAIGFDVLQKVVEEIQKGYALAKEYNEKQRRAEAAGEPRPPVPWPKVAERGKELQNVAFEAMRKGNEILLESTRSGMSAAVSFVETLANVRTDVDEKLPRLAGPVFDSLTMKAAPGQSSIEASWPIRNRGLARLRIHATAEALQYRRKSGDRRRPDPPPLNVKVAFEPNEKNPETSILTVRINKVPDDQPTGTYEGSITADNFDLFIGQLRVEVAEPAYSSARRSRKTRATPRARG